MSELVHSLEGMSMSTRCRRVRSAGADASESAIAPIFRGDISVPMSSRRCKCGAYWRPDIVWFEDALDADVVRRAGKALEECDLLVSIGTSAVVYPAAEFPRIAIERGAATVEINLEDTPLSHLYTHRLRGRASEVLAALDR